MNQNQKMMTRENLAFNVALALYTLAFFVVSWFATFLMSEYFVILIPPAILVWLAGLAIFPPRIIAVLTCCKR